MGFLDFASATLTPGVDTHTGQYGNWGRTADKWVTLCVCCELGPQKYAAEGRISGTMHESGEGFKAHGVCVEIEKAMEAKAGRLCDGRDIKYRSWV